MPNNLVIVESPAKARTVERYLGSDYSVKSSFGHIRDLPKKGLSIDLANGFKPDYEISADKRKVVKELKQAAARASSVWLASDEDREGEAIAWHLTEALGLDPKKTKRIVFHEITRPAIEAAVKKPRQVDMKLVDAQQARRVLDRLVGYELSPVLWKKVTAGLSAGRVQSVAVRLVVDRERAIRDFSYASSYRVVADFEAGGASLPAELDKRLPDLKVAQSWLDKTATASFRVAGLVKKPARRSPAAPFTTSTLQQEASRRLGFSVRQTMTLAQRLYESGHITYMRTDSTTLSNLAIAAAAKYIKSNFGVEYQQTRQYKSKIKSAQEAHEAIRPTDFKKTSAGSDDSQAKLYQLIWQRALASQMSQARLERTEVTIDISNQPEHFIAKGAVLIFDGYLKVYGQTKEDIILPSIKQGQELFFREITATETLSRAPARFTEASLVRRLEDLGIGRPSTYAPTISTIQSRGYIEKGDVMGEIRDSTELRVTPSGKVQSSSAELRVGADQGKLLPTYIAEVVTDFLTSYFPSIVDYDFTARVEQDFDNIANGGEAWNQMIKDFYKDFHPLVEKAEGVSRAEVAQAKELGIDPASGKKVFARFGRYGPMIQRGETEGEDKPDFAPLPAGSTIDSVTLKDALKMLELPRTVGQTTGGEAILAGIGRYGPYIQIAKQYISLKEQDPYTVTEAEARQLYREKQAADKAKNIKELSGGIKILNGPYGPYVSDGQRNARIPKEMEPTKISFEQATDLLAKAKTAKKGRASRPRR